VLTLSYLALPVLTSTCVTQAEEEASAELPEGHSLQVDIYDVIKSAVADIITAMNAPPAAPASSTADPTGAAAVSAGQSGDTLAQQAGPPLVRPPPPTTKRPEAIEAGEIEEDDGPAAPLSATSNNNSNGGSDAATSGNYYNRLDGLIEGANSSGVVITATLAEQVAVDEAGEKMLMSEIERFRLRQLQRDK
jgi:hypothetical protein